jgi:hypothetical protein
MGERYILIILQDMTWEKDMPQQRALIFSSRHCYKTKGLPYIRITTRNCILSATMFMIPAPIIQEVSNRRNFVQISGYFSSEINPLYGLKYKHKSICTWFTFELTPYTFMLIFKSWIVKYKQNLIKLCRLRKVVDHI